jgi:hypothetical protein
VIAVAPLTRIAAPALIVMFAVVAYVGAASWNRSAEPGLTITVTERELPIQVTPATPGDDPGVFLQIAYEGRHDPLDARNWLPESRLREMGFALNVPAGEPRAADAYDKVPPRMAWVALEYDGPAWRDSERRRALSAEQYPRHGRFVLSRLVPVDAAADFETLQRRYPSGHLIVRALIGVVYLPAINGGPLIYGALRDIVPQTIAVPARLRGVFDKLQPHAENTEFRPRYEAEIAVGRLGLVYLRSARSIEP